MTLALLSLSLLEAACIAWPSYKRAHLCAMFVSVNEVVGFCVVERE